MLSARRLRAINDLPKAGYWIIDLGARQCWIASQSRLYPSNHQNRASRQERGGVMRASHMQTAGQTPGLGRWIIKLGAVLRGIDAPSHQHLPVGQERRGVTGTRHIETAGFVPPAGARIIHFSADQVLVILLTTCHQYVSVRQKSRRVSGARQIEITGFTPYFRLWIVQLGLGIIELGGSEFAAASDEDFSVGQQGGGMGLANNLHFG